MQKPKDQLNQFLIPLCFFMRLSREAYSRYLHNKIYLHALTIRLANRRICKLVEKKTALIPSVLENDVLQLLNHYDAWFTQFRKHKKKIKPGLKDEFVFFPVDDQSPFPKEAEENIFRYTRSAKEQFEQHKQIAQS